MLSPKEEKIQILGEGVYLRSTVYSAPCPYGSSDLSELFNTDLSSLGALCSDQSLFNTSLDDLLLLDLETTGLYHSSETYIIAVGSAHFRDGNIIVQQLSIEHPDYERDMLAYLLNSMTNFSTILSFNGKMFDLPMLEFRCSELALDWKAIAVSIHRHADMLYPARRLWKERLISCRLANLERELLGVVRVDDLPSKLIPEMYALYLLQGNPEIIDLILDHNKYDLLALTGITLLACQLYNNGYKLQSLYPLDAYSLGKIYESNGEYEKALIVYNYSLSYTLPRHIQLDICRRLSSIIRGMAQKSDLIVALHNIALHSDNKSALILEELAKHYEHEERNYYKALEMVQTAITIAASDCCLHTNLRRLRKRLNRLQSKIDGLHITPH
ncbi:exonuclease-like protein [Thermobaculum terrenum ATCC BAA-798]|uniref:Exonuclease-like protein n=1 Tax=Thermobaculum terrenum (strain ATCC BAA-798 / CCMEE 7001 / YNP1) TaxID=525904 RepID=D1CG55_THET1|nr:ribonuclease H-like domain-containing protein [Thermobaculum terrenum]ACZ41911.1 exonuclease-like protein [Thermobaculum terrenum ATCC BAA-798]